MFLFSTEPFFPKDLDSVNLLGLLTKDDKIGGKIKKSGFQ